MKKYYGSSNGLLKPLMLAITFICILHISRESYNIKNSVQTNIVFTRRRISRQSFPISIKRKSKELNDEEEEVVAPVLEMKEVIEEEIEKGPRLNSTLPRTGVGNYNIEEPGHKYLLYSPSGGFNNQLACMLSASYLAKKYNRTLIVPPNGKHSSMAWGYYALKESDVTPMDHALDFQFMSEKLGVRLLALNTTIKNYHKRYLLAKRRESTKRLDVIHAPKRAGFYNSPPSVLKKYVEMGQKSKKPFLWFEGRFYTKYWAIKYKLYKYIRYSPYLRTLSTNIVNEMFNGTFNSFHIRMGDYTKYMKAESVNSANFVSASKRYGFKRNIPIYIATDGNKNHKYFHALKLHFKNVYFQTDLINNPKVQIWIRNFNRRVPKAAKNDLFGLVEQMICVQSSNYVGTAVSTFSQTIAKTRRSVRNALPEIDPNKVKISALIHWDGKLSYLKRAPDAEKVTN